MPTVAIVALLFFVSGLSGLIYQVVWVREFGNVFGNTVYSASLVIAVFMLGLGAGSYAVGRWADRQYARRPESLLLAYGVVEIVIGAAALAVSLFLPHLGAVSASVSSYVREANGWHALSLGSHAMRSAIAALVLTPITILMGGTLTLLIRYFVRVADEEGAARIAVLYGINTVGAAAGAFLTDFVLVRAVGLQRTQWLAVLGNIAVGIVAIALASGRRPDLSGPARRPDLSGPASSSSALAWTSLAIAMSGFAAMGMEIVWFRHFTLLLGGFRAVFSLLLMVILIGIGAGALAGGWLHRTIGRPVQLLMLGEALFVASTVAGLAAADLRGVLTQEAYISGARLRELLLMMRPMLVEVGVPAFVMGLTFPLANAVVQHAEQAVGRRAGALYLSNTVGAVCGSLAAGFLLLPVLGMQRSATLLLIVAAASVMPLAIAGRARRSIAVPVVALGIGAAAVASLLRMPPDFVIGRAQMALPPGQQRLTLVEGVNEVVSVVDVGAGGRLLLTNDHSMSGTTPGAQRYMRALAHIPLLSIERPSAALVIGFGVGNTTHAISLHPAIRRIEIADLSRAILDHASYFAHANQHVLADPRIAVYVEDGRQHLRMARGEPYDLIALEPPPIAQAGVGALYSREFYRLARARLAPGGYISQWLPAYQVPPGTTLAMIRAFVDVFPQAVLLCGTSQELLLVGANGPRVEIDPERVAAALAAAPAVQSDLQRVGFATIAEIVATFVAGPRTLDEASRGRAPVTDDRPIQEYGARSRLTPAYEALPAAIFNLGEVAAWCPRCFAGGRPAPIVAGLDRLLAERERVYQKMRRE
jgi:spermidine synthase